MRLGSTPRSRPFLLDRRSFCPPDRQSASVSKAKCEDPQRRENHAQRPAAEGAVRQSHLKDLRQVASTNAWPCQQRYTPHLEDRARSTEGQRYCNIGDVPCSNARGEPDAKGLEGGDRTLRAAPRRDTKRHRCPKRRNWTKAVRMLKYKPVASRTYIRSHPKGRNSLDR
jgi:hypothetical protein